MAIGKVNKMKMNHIIAAILLLLFLLLGGCAGKSYLEETTESSDGSQETDMVQENKEEASPKEDACLYVQVCGAVVSPGVYRLPEGSRIFEAIALAGGLREDAGDRSLNQAAILSDGQQIYVPTEEEEALGLLSSDGTMTSDPSGKVNINTATEAELMTLSGIGAGKAKAIISYREEHGSFAEPSDLKKVSGIGDGTYEKIVDDISVR